LSWLFNHLDIFDNYFARVLLNKSGMEAVGSDLEIAVWCFECFEDVLEEAMLVG
jgi:hypothetical protein